jgi:3-oxoacyl-[acyl-carrier protein] reductase
VGTATPRRCPGGRCAARGTRTQAFDVADPAAVAHAAEDALRALGRIDVLVCSAGITGPNTTTWEYPVDAWRQVIDVNLNGLFYCNRYRAGDAQNDYGRIVNIASVAGRRATRMRRRTARRRPA